MHGVLTGNTTPQVDRIPGYAISYPYQNSSDTLQSVYYNITPKVDNAICVPGKTVSSEIKVHATPLQNLIITTPLTCNGGSDAALRAIPSKGAGPYYFDWVRPGTDHIFGYGITDLINVKGGRWDVTVTDNLGCSNSMNPYLLQELILIHICMLSIQPALAQHALVRMTVRSGSRRRIRQLLFRHLNTGWSETIRILYTIAFCRQQK